MNNDAKLTAIKAAIYEMGLRFNQQPSNEKIHAYAYDLLAYTPQQITYAFRQVIGSGSAFFPSLAEILAHLRPKEISSEDRANIIAKEIISKTLLAGSYNLKKAMDDLSTEAKDIVGSSTYMLREIVESDRKELPIIESQIRRLAIAKINQEKNKSHNETLLLLSGNKSLEIENMKLEKIV